ncbi:MAG: hypothetical protein ACFFAY_11170 [Promethearchaeota archaeon]
MRIVRVIKTHRPESSDSLKMNVGDLLRGEERKTRWDGWIWCTNESGISAGIPEVYLSKQSQSGLYKALRDYDSFELSVDIGGILTVKETAASWAWVENPDGEEGWVPLENLVDASDRN